MDLSIVIPCYNELDSLATLAERLDVLQSRMHPDKSIELIFIDDGSEDKTYDKLVEIYRDQKGVTIIQHIQNRGLGAAVKTGIEKATGAFVATIDSDCTYDPLILPDMLMKMEPDVDVMTASPYAPGGEILNVSPFQIFVSQGCSRLYRLILNSHIHTFTSMFRIYRRSALERISFESSTFLSMAEIIIKAILQKMNVQEYPTALSARQFGYSKRKMFRLTLEHLKLMLGIVLRRRD